MYLGMGQGATASTSKKPCLISLFFRSAAFYYIYIWIYRKHSTVCKSIHFHYIVIMEGERLSATFPGRETCWSWSPTFLQLCCGWRSLRNLSTQSDNHVSIATTAASCLKPGEQWRTWDYRERRMVYEKIGYAILDIIKYGCNMVGHNIFKWWKKFLVLPTLVGSNRLTFFNFCNKSSPLQPIFLGFQHFSSSTLI